MKGCGSGENRCWVARQEALLRLDSRLNMRGVVVVFESAAEAALFPKSFSRKLRPLSDTKAPSNRTQTHIRPMSSIPPDDGIQFYGHEVREEG